MSALTQQQRVSSTATRTVDNQSSIQSYHLLTPSTQPIPLLTKPVARAFSNAYTVGVLMYYYLRASALVSDPLPTLIYDLFPLISFQALFCLLCVPGAGHWNSGTEIGSKSGIKGSSTGGARNQNERRAGPAGGSGGFREVTSGPLQHRIMPTIFSLVLALTVTPVPLAILALVLGAPLFPFSLLPHTLAIAAHVSILAMMPLFYTHGVSSMAWRDFAAAWLPFDEAGVWAGTVGCMVGGWIGAIPMALDWDREWQKWPCTVIWGVALGWGVGRFLTSVLRIGIGTRINMSEGLRVNDVPAARQTVVVTEERKGK